MLPTFADVERAARRIAGAAHRTPVISSTTVDTRTGAHVFFKCENLQRAGAFKFRGAYNALSSLSPDERQRGVQGAPTLRLAQLMRQYLAQNLMGRR